MNRKDKILDLMYTVLNSYNLTIQQTLYDFKRNASQYELSQLIFEAKKLRPVRLGFLLFHGDRSRIGVSRLNRRDSQNAEESHRSPFFHIIHRFSQTFKRHLILKLKPLWNITKSLDKYIIYDA